MTDIHANTIVVATDGSSGSEEALRWAAEQADLERRTLTVVSVAQHPAPVAVAGGAVAIAYNEEDLLEMARNVAVDGATVALQHRPGITVQTTTLTGEPRTALASLTASARLLVLGSRGRGEILSKVLGSVGASVGRRASCPVVVCRPGKQGVQRGVLVGADGTEESLPVLEFAFLMASMRSHLLTVVNTTHDVVSSIQGAHAARSTDAGLEGQLVLLAESVAGFREIYPEVTVAVEAARGYPADALTALADGFDLVVVGRHPVDSPRRHASSTVATAVLERSHARVAVVPEASPGRSA